MSIFTVVIPAFNASGEIRQTLDSVASQTFTSFKVVVIDDGSMDGTGQIALEWAYSHSEFQVSVYRQCNQGPAAARNRGLKFASSPYVAFLDSDDRWRNDKLEKVYAALKGEHRTDVVTHDMKIVHENGTIDYFEAGPHDEYRPLLLNGNCLHTSATVVRTEIVRKQGGFREDARLVSVEDYDLWLRLAYSEAEFRFINEPLGEYDLRKKGISHQPKLHCRNTRHLIDVHTSNLDLSLSDRYQLRGRRAEALRRAGAILLRQGAVKEGFTYLMRAVADAPENPYNIACIIRDLICAPLFEGWKDIVRG